MYDEKTEIFEKIMEQQAKGDYVVTLKTQELACDIEMAYWNLEELVKQDGEVDYWNYSVKQCEPFKRTVTDRHGLVYDSPWKACIIS